MTGLPAATTKKGFFEKKWVPDVFEAGGGLLAILPILLLAYKTYYSVDENVTYGDRWLAFLALIAVLAVFVKGAVKVYQNVRVERRESELANQLDGIVSGLEIIHSIVRHMHKFSRHDHLKLRLTLYRVADSLTNPGERELEQIVEYVGGSGTKKRKGRRFPIRCGLIGKVASSGDPQGASREDGDYEAYLRELEVEWNFSREQAVQLSKERNSFFAVPITYREEVTAVVYMDSSERNFFPDNVKRSVIVACLGLAVFINGRYYND